jgi:putative oxidoreductase
MSASIVATVAVRYVLVCLFLPFSLLDKTVNFRGALQQVRQIAPAGLAVPMILMAVAIEFVMPLAILTGTADRAAGLVMAGYCIVTALLWKQFWQPGDFWHAGESRARDLFWDFLKNVSLAGGFLILVVGAHGTLAGFVSHPFASSHPYSQQAAP